mmetsp:Transcript_5123/g.7497  ORF Transcript_5123/g.7497 Transcript_5123/m.7497 type:complete len:91 (-) Transcript_5123:127-399(-)
MTNENIITHAYPQEELRLEEAPSAIPLVEILTTNFINKNNSAQTNMHDTLMLDMDWLMLSSGENPQEGEELSLDDILEEALVMIKFLQIL